MPASTDFDPAAAAVAQAAVPTDTVGVGGVDLVEFSSFCVVVMATIITVLLLEARRFSHSSFHAGTPPLSRAVQLAAADKRGSLDLAVVVTLLCLAVVDVTCCDLAWLGVMMEAADADDDTPRPCLLGTTAGASLAVSAAATGSTVAAATERLSDSHDADVNSGDVSMLLLWPSSQAELDGGVTTLAAASPP